MYKLCAGLDPAKRHRSIVTDFTCAMISHLVFYWERKEKPPLLPPPPFSLVLPSYLNLQHNLHKRFFAIFLSCSSTNLTCNNLGLFDVRYDSWDRCWLYWLILLMHVLFLPYDLPRAFISATLGTKSQLCLWSITYCRLCLFGPLH